MGLRDMFNHLKEKKEKEREIAIEEGAKQKYEMKQKSAAERALEKILEKKRQESIKKTLEQEYKKQDKEYWHKDVISQKYMFKDHTSIMGGKKLFS